MTAINIQYTDQQARPFADVTPAAGRHRRMVAATPVVTQREWARLFAGEMIGLAMIASATTERWSEVLGLGAPSEELSTTCAWQRLNALRATCPVITGDTMRLINASHIEVGVPAPIIPGKPFVSRFWSVALSEGIVQFKMFLPFASKAVGGNRS